MLQFIRSTIIYSCVILGACISVTLVRGQVPDKKRNLPDKKAVRAMVSASSPDVSAPPMLTPEPGSSDAERMAAFQARVKAGLEPTVHIGRDPKLRLKKLNRMPDFVPTQIVPQKGAKGEMLAFQQKLLPAFARNDPMPASRSAHFAWLNNHTNARIFGWCGTVTGAEVQPDSSVIVNIEFHPKTDITGMRGYVPDYVMEKYHVSNGVLNLIDTDAAINNPAIQVIQSL